MGPIAFPIGKLILSNVERLQLPIPGTARLPELLKESAANRSLETKNSQIDSLENPPISPEHTIGVPEPGCTFHQKSELQYTEKEAQRRSDDGEPRPKRRERASIREQLQKPARVLEVSAVRWIREVGGRETNGVRKSDEPEVWEELGEFFVNK